MVQKNSVTEVVQNYYGSVLSSSEDLKTNACCTLEEIPEYIKKATGKIHDEVLSKYYGCGLVIPQTLEGMRVLDIGCGTGKDCYLLSQLVGEEGSVLGIDITDEQLAVAKEHLDYHRNAFGYTKGNVAFQKANIETIDTLDLPENSFDIVVSNCVFNLIEDKQKAFQNVFRLLKPGGEMYFSDVYSDRRIPQHLTADPVLYGECLSGALYWKDFLRIAAKAGFIDPRLSKSSPITINEKEVETKLGEIKFFSATYRLFKLASLEDACEDYGQAIIYKGGIPHSEAYFDLDEHHHFPKGKTMPVCSNTFDMLAQTRFQEYFEFIGNTETHYGIFEGCGISLPFTEANVANAGAACC
ncbi:MAG: methyltransferase domain-containing protein [Spirochaetota bacterium]